MLPIILSCNTLEKLSLQETLQVVKIDVVDDSKEHTRT